MPWRRRTAPSPNPPLSSGQRSPDSLTWVNPELLTWISAVDVTRLSAGTAKNAEHFLRDRRLGSLGARRETALRLRSAIEAQIGEPAPPTVTSMDVIAAVLSARREQLD
jgi:hypothetical protein